MSTHKQVALHYSGPIMVDEGIAPLLKALWRKHIYTTYSCQGSDESPGYIMFPRRIHAAYFYHKSNHYITTTRDDFGDSGTRVQFAAEDLPKLLALWTDSGGDDA